MINCHHIYGNTDVYESEPSVVSLKDAIYIPIGHTCRWGIYDIGRRPVLPSFYFAGPSPSIDAGMLQIQTSQISDVYNDECLYGGFLNEHFGHFMLSTLSRLWPLVRSPEWNGCKIVCHSLVSPVTFFQQRPWAAEMIAALGISPSSFVVLDRASTIRSLTVPYPSFEETNFAHRVFADLCHRIGDRLMCGSTPSRNERPAYLSKQHLTSGVRRIENEHVAAEIIRAKGVDIIYPEQLSFAEQIAFWRSRTCVASFVGSALHTSIFAPGKRVVAYSDSTAINSNFVLIDQVNDAKALYLASIEGELLKRDPTPGFHQVLSLADPASYADAILEAIEDLSSHTNAG